MKTCNKCQQPKPETDFYANKRMKDGLNTFCILCHKADNVARKAVRRADPKFRSAELAYKKEYRNRSAEAIKQYMEEWRKQNAEHLAAYAKKRHQTHKAYYNFATQKRKIAIQNRTPKWLSPDDFWVMQEAYHLAHLRSKATGIKWHVDHKIPLHGARVSGLHTPLNLQVIPATVNQRKTNKFEV